MKNLTSNNAFERTVKYGGPRHGHRGRPLNSVVRRTAPMPWKKVDLPAQREIDAYVRQFKKKARFLVDESLGSEAAKVIRELGWNVKYVDEVALVGHSDEDVFAFAWSDDRILLTHDRDFWMTGLSPLIVTLVWLFFPAVMVTRLLSLRLYRLFCPSSPHSEKVIREPRLLSTPKELGPW